MLKRARVVEVGPPGMTFTVRSLLVPRGGEKEPLRVLKGALSWGRSWGSAAELMGGAASWSLCGLEGKHAQENRSGRDTSEGRSPDKQG